MRSGNILLRTAVRVMYAAATDILYRAVSVDTVEPVQRLLEKHTAGQAIPCFMLSEDSLNCTYESTIGKKKSQRSSMQSTLSHIICFRPSLILSSSTPENLYLSLPFRFPSHKCIQVSYLFHTFKFPCLSYRFCFIFGRSRVSNLGSNLRLSWWVFMFLLSSSNQIKGQDITTCHAHFSTWPFYHSALLNTCFKNNSIDNYHTNESIILSHQFRN